MSEDIDLDTYWGEDDYEYIQEYIEEHSRRMNEKKFQDRYRIKSSRERLLEERTAEVWEIEERKEWDIDSEYEDNQEGGSE